MKQKVVYYARGGRIAKMGPFKTELSAWKALRGLNGLPLVGAAVWPEKRKLCATKKSKIWDRNQRKLLGVDENYGAKSETVRTTFYCVSSSELHIMNSAAKRASESVHKLEDGDLFAALCPYELLSSLRATCKGTAFWFDWDFLFEKMVGWNARHYLANWRIRYLCELARVPCPVEGSYTGYFSNAKELQWLLARARIHLLAQVPWPT